MFNTWHSLISYAIFTTFCNIIALVSIFLMFLSNCLFRISCTLILFYKKNSKNDLGQHNSTLYFFFDSHFHNEKFSNAIKWKCVYVSCRSLLWQKTLYEEEKGSRILLINVTQAQIPPFFFACVLVFSVVVDP